MKNQTIRDLILAGHTNQEIVAMLGVTANSVRSKRWVVNKKLAGAKTKGKAKAKKPTIRELVSAGRYSNHEIATLLGVRLRSVASMRWLVGVELRTAAKNGA